jgi:hypothetical protein
MYPGQYGMSKNWAAFTNAIGEVFIHTNLVPQRIYKLRITGPDDLPHYNSPATQLPIMSPLPHDPIADSRNCLATTLNLSNVHKVDLHQSSPMLEVILCTSDQIDSGVCDPSNPRNRVFIMLIQLVHRGDGTYNDLSYEPRIVTLNSTAPYNYLSVSKPFVYGIP